LALGAAFRNNAASGAGRFWGLSVPVSYSNLSTATSLVRLYPFPAPMMRKRVASKNEMCKKHTNQKSADKRKDIVGAVSKKKCPKSFFGQSCTIILPGFADLKL